MTAPPGFAVKYGLVHAWVGQIVLKCNDFKTLFAIGPISRSGASLTLLQVTADLPLPYGGMAASDGHAAIAFSTAGGSIDEAEACTQRFPSSVHRSLTRRKRTTLRTTLCMSTGVLEY